MLQVETLFRQFTDYANPQHIYGLSNQTVCVFECISVDSVYHNRGIFTFIFFNIRYNDLQTQPLNPGSYNPAFEVITSPLDACWGANRPLTPIGAKRDFSCI